MKDDEVWAQEERLWLEGADAYRELLDPCCLMAFAPVGILSAPDIVDKMDEAPRWSSVKMSEKAVGRPDDETMVLAYRAAAESEESTDYAAYCTSTYRHLEGRWVMVQHQQTPADG